MPIQPKQQPPYYTPTTGVKIYKAQIRQTGTNNPTLTILQNTIGDIVWTREGVGSYKGTLTGAFGNETTLNTIFGDFGGDGNPYIPISQTTSITGYYTMYLNPENEIFLLTVDNTFAAAEMSTLLGTTRLPINIEFFT